MSDEALTRALKGFSIDPDSYDAFIFEVAIEWTVNKTCKWLNSINLDYYSKHTEQLLQDYCKIMEVNYEL